MQTCTQLRHETREVWYTQNKFQTDDKRCNVRNDEYFRKWDAHMTAVAEELKLPEKGISLWPWGPYI